MSHARNSCRQSMLVPGGAGAWNDLRQRMEVPVKGLSYPKRACKPLERGHRRSSRTVCDRETPDPLLEAKRTAWGRLMSWAS